MFLIFSVVKHISMICFSLFFSLKQIHFLYSSLQVINSSNVHCLYSKYSYWGFFGYIFSTLIQDTILLGMAALQEKQSSQVVRVLLVNTVKLVQDV